MCRSLPDNWRVHLLKGEEIDGKKPFDISKLNYRLKGSFAFMNSSLAILASSIEKEDLISNYDLLRTIL